jgi:hypothetical protein
MRLKDARCRISSMLGRLREEGGVLSDTWEQFLDLLDPELLADAELPNDRLIALGIVSFEVVQ